MAYRRFPKLPGFRRPLAAEDVWKASSEDIAAGSWADTFRAEHADLVGKRPVARPRRYRWLVATSIFGLVGMAALLHPDLRRVASGSQRGLDVDQRRIAIAEAVSQELVRTREVFEAYRVQATRDLAAIQDTLVVRETALHQVELARQAADDLATDRARTIEAMASDLALAQRKAAEVEAAITEVRTAAHAAAQAAQAVVRSEVAGIEVVPPSPSPIVTATEPSDVIPAKAEGRAESPGLPAAERALDERPRFGRSDMAWLPLAETAFMALDAGHAGTDAAHTRWEGGGPFCLDGLPALPRITSPPVTGKGARRTRADAGTAGQPRVRQRAGVRGLPTQTRGAGAKQRRAPDVGADFLIGERPALLPGRS